MAKFLHGVQLDIVCARGLLAADKGGTSDPFAKAILVEGDSGKDLDAYSFTTKTWRATLDPDWAETCVLGDKMKSIELCVARFDEDTKASFMDLYTKIDSGIEVGSETSEEVETEDAF